MDARRPQLHATRLLDLPDELLSTILRYLLEEGEATYVNPLAAEPPASFPLALTCTRLLSLFRPTLHTLDTPSTQYNAYPFVIRDPPPGVLPVSQSTDHHPVMASHLAALVRLAGPHLRTLRLTSRRLTSRPACPLEAVLAALVSHCPNLTTLSYTNASKISWLIERAVFTSLPSLTRLRIDHPSSALLSLGESRGLTHLSLFAVSNWHAVEKILGTAGQHLRVLDLGILARGGVAKHFHTIATFLRARMAHDLPMLEQLSISDRKPKRETMQNGPAGPGPNANTFAGHIEQTIARRIEAARKANTNGPGLARIAISVGFGGPVECVSLFMCFVRPETVVELSFQYTRLMWR